MEREAEDRKTGNEEQFELKYCERCGGLWLRPLGGGQIYCGSCSREMVKLPSVREGKGNARVPRGPRWDGDEEGIEADGNEEINLDSMGGVA